MNLSINRLFNKSNFDFTKYRFTYFIFSSFLIILSVTLVATKGLNFGIDFKGGIVIEARFPTDVNISFLRAKINNLNLGDASLQQFGEKTDVLIRLARQKGDEKQQQLAVEKVKKTLGKNIEYRRVEFVGPQVSSELLSNGIWAVSLSLIAILSYIWVRFEWQFGVGAIIALLHDVISTLALFSLLQLDFNLTTVAAILTIAGYSINDTVVVFDRVRENLRKYKKMPLPELLNLSINRTLSRTIITALTTLLTALSLLIFGGETIKGFSIALVWGLCIGTYSSICVAVPILIQTGVKFKNREKKGAIEEDKFSAEHHFNKGRK